MGGFRWQHGVLAISLTLIMAMGHSTSAVAQNGRDGRKELRDRADEFEPIDRVQFEDADLRTIARMIADTTGMGVFVSPAVDAEVTVWAREINPVALLDRAVALAGVTYYVHDGAINIVTPEASRKRHNPSMELRVIQLDQARADQVAETLRELLPSLGPRLLISRTGQPVPSPGAATPTGMPSPQHLPQANQEPKPKGTDLPSRESPGGNANLPPIPNLDLPYENTKSIRVIPDERTNSVVVHAPKHRMKAIESLVSDLDIQINSLPNLVRVYRLENTDAASVAQVIQDLLSQQAGHADAAFARGPPEGPGGSDDGYSQLGIVDYTSRKKAASRGSDSSQDEQNPQRAEGAGNPAGESPGDRPRISVDKALNAVIIRATSAQQEQLSKLIDELDQPRSQVMIQAILVQVSNTDGLNFGVELEGRFGSNPALQLLSSFGLSSVDPETGDRIAAPSRGGNAFVVRPDYIPVVIKALKKASNVTISSMPRLLINDNATGSIEGVDEEPFTSLNAGETVSTTSFSGYAQAGTTLKVTPHISKGSFIRLETQLTLNNFTGSPRDGVPPPRTTNNVQTEAVVPDGHTIILGGLRTKTDRNNVERVPVLGELPVIEHLFKSTDRQHDEATLFVFLRPTILRGREFAALKAISSHEAEAAGIDRNTPTNDIMTFWDEQEPSSGGAMPRLRNTDSRGPAPATDRAPMPDNRRQQDGSRRPNRRPR